MTRKSQALLFLLILAIMMFILYFTMVVSGKSQGSDTQGQESQTALVPRPMAPKQVAANPYMADSDNAIHNDVYATDVTDAVAPLGICSKLTTSVETQNIQAPSAAFYDTKGNAVTPYLGGVAIVTMDGETVEHLGSFVPGRDDGGGYSFQISYSLVDSKDNVVVPTSDGRILVLRTMDEAGNILPVFEKVMDIDLMAQAEAQLTGEIDQNLLSIVYDYAGNLWFTTGGFRINPHRGQQGFLGYISAEYMHQEEGEHLSLANHIFFYPLEPGEGAENGIAANEDGAVILTNLACYMLTAEDGVQVTWRTPYGSNGANDAEADSGYTGGGLAWGSGASPTLTDDLVIFTDNLDPVNLIALSSETGGVVAQIPVLDALGEDTPVSVENSILVYASGDGSASVIVANWFGAGNAGLAEPDADSSIQSYENIYDANWTARGNAYIASGVERVDVIKTDQGYGAKKVWSRSDIHETAMIKLSTATGYLYGYWQDLDSGMWVYDVLDFATGQTVLRQEVSSLSGYNNMAVGLIIDPDGNGIYCPTNTMEMVCWQDDFAYLPNSPAKQISPQDQARSSLYGQALPGDWTAASYLMTVTVDNLREEDTLALRLNGLSASPQDYVLLYEDPNGDLREVPVSWSLCAAGGGDQKTDQTLSEDTLYEVRVSIADGSPLDLSSQEYQGVFSVMLAVKQ